MNPKHPLLARPTSVPSVIASLAIVLTAAGGAMAGDATLQAGNSPFSINLTAAGEAMDSGFNFEIGTFDPGLAPTAANVDAWMGHWYPVSDSAGNVLPEASVAYDDSELGAPFPPGSRANQFSITVTLTHNNFPFATDAPVYIWGFDRRQGGGNAEWILITNPGWRWPTITPGGGPVIRTFDVSHPDSHAIFGQVNQDGIEMRTGSITLPTPGGGYDAWLAVYFAAEELADPAWESSRWGFAADADGDGIPNAIEFLSGTIPTSGQSHPTFAVDSRGDVLRLVFTRRRDSGAIAGVVEWSTDLREWSTAGVAEVVVEDLGDYERIEASIAFPAKGQAYLRLVAIAP